MNNLLILPACFLSLSLRAFTIQTLFNWFIATAFNIHPITFLVGLAISVISEYLPPVDFTKAEMHDNSIRIAVSIIRSVFVLIFSSILHQFY